MVAYLSEAWLDAPVDPAVEALARTGASASIARVVSGAPDGEARFTARMADGSVAYEAGVADDVDLTLTDTYANAVAILRAELDPNATFMRGQTKVSGSTRVLVDLLAATRSEAYRADRAALLAAVEL